MTNLAPIPDGLSDEQVLMCPDIMSTGFSGAERGKVRIGDTVAVFAQGPIGLCATAGARLMGAATIIGVDAVPARMEIARKMGADHVVDFTKVDAVDEIMRLTDGRGVDVAIEALGRQQTFEAALRVLRPGGTLSSLGVCSSDLRIPLVLPIGRNEHPCGCAAGLSTVAIIPSTPFVTALLKPTSGIRMLVDLPPSFRTSRPTVLAAAWATRKPHGSNR